MCSSNQPQSETFETSCSPFWFSCHVAMLAFFVCSIVWQGAHLAKPLLVVVVAVNPSDAEAFGMSLALLLANLVFLAWKYVRIVIVDSGTYSIIQHPLYDG